jgi:hypothetical protein
MLQSQLLLFITMHKRNLPHIYPQGADFFVTFRIQFYFTYRVARSHPIGKEGKEIAT